MATIETANVGSARVVGADASLKSYLDSLASPEVRCD